MNSVITTLGWRELNEVWDIVANSRHAAREISKVCSLLLHKGKKKHSIVLFLLGYRKTTVLCSGFFKIRSKFNGEEMFNLKQAMKTLRRSRGITLLFF